MNLDYSLQDQINSLSTLRSLESYSDRELEDELRKRKEDREFDAYIKTVDLSHIECPFDRAHAEQWHRMNFSTTMGVFSDLNEAIRKSLTAPEKP